MTERAHCPGCGGWVATHSGQGEGYECPGVHPRDNSLDVAIRVLHAYRHPDRAGAVGSGICDCVAIARRLATSQEEAR